MDLSALPAAEEMILIAGPTASGKSGLAMQLAAQQGRTIVNADALQVFENWRVLTARPSQEDEASVPHALYGHVAYNEPYSVGDWLRAIEPFLDLNPAPIIVGGTGLYFTALTEGLADIPPTPKDVRDDATNTLKKLGLNALLSDLDAETLSKIDTQNPMRVQRAWEVLKTTGKGLAFWQAQTPPPKLPLDRANALLIDAPKDWLTPRIEMRFDQMIEQGALDEANANLTNWSPEHPSSKAIGAAELIASVRGDMPLDAAREAAIIATRQYAKRQRSWFRARMQGWKRILAQDL